MEELIIKLNKAKSLSNGTSLITIYIQSHADL